MSTTIAHCEMKLGGQDGVFVDWLTASQHHPQGGLPVLSGGLTVHYDASGVPRFERNCAASIPGSYETSVRVGCDGFRVSLSGNPGRFSRQDNLFNFGFSGTLAKANRILLGAGFPPFSASRPLFEGENPISKDEAETGIRRGALVSRLDLTANYATGSEPQARSVIRWLADKSVARMKRGRAGDESVWWANTRHMLKAYIKHLEMVSHGSSIDEFAVQWCKNQGVVRMEIELKKRLLSELGLNEIGNITDEKLAALFHDQTEIFRSVDRSDEPDILAAIPSRSRAYAAAWLAGVDVRTLCGRSTLFVHARILREYGLDILEPRNIERFPVKVRVIDLVPLQVPDWYLKEHAA